MPPMCFLLIATSAASGKLAGRQASLLCTMHQHNQYTAPMMLLMSAALQDRLELEVLMRSGSEKEKVVATP